MLLARTLRRYIARRFFVMIVGAFSVCALLIFMIDLIELLRQARSAQSLTLPRLMWIGFLRLPSFSELLLPFAVLVGSIGALLSLSRKSELTVMRAGGMSAWQFLRPGLTVALSIGVFATTVYNPLAAGAKSEAERLMAEAFGREMTLMTSGNAGAWLRQTGTDNQSVMTARAVADKGLVLAGVMAFVYDRDGRFVERLDADKALLREGYWQLERVTISRPRALAEFKDTHRLSTALEPERVQDALGSVESVSIWELPGVIEMADKAELPASRYRVQYQLLLARPLLLIAMVLLAATVSLRSFRQGGIQTMVVTGMVGGIGFFLLTEVSRQIGLAGLVSAAVAVWIPIFVACLTAVSVLLHQEDG
jgi:lipopolysaccharide export system permease protein